MIEFNATFLIAMLSFVVFIIIMNAIFYQPVLNIIRKRDDYINSNYADSKEILEEAKLLENERKNKISAKQTECRKSFNSAVSEFQQKASAKLKAAKDLNKTKLMEEKQELQQSENELKEQLKNTVVNDLASAITEKLLSNCQVKMK